VQESILEDPNSSDRMREQESSRGANMANINSPLKQNDEYHKSVIKSPETVKKMQQLHNARTRTIVQKHSENPVSENTENLEYALSKAKTVCKSGYFHGNDNIILIFRSMEILMSSSGENKKKFSPIYVPVDIVNKLYRFNTKELLKLLFDHVSFNKNNVKLDLNKLRTYLQERINKTKDTNEFLHPESGVIKTSYMANDNDYGVTIKFPYL
jgi:hypothetical protein